jgi:hypothetical protein
VRIRAIRGQLFSKGLTSDKIREDSCDSWIPLAKNLTKGVQSCFETQKRNGVLE